MMIERHNQYAETFRAPGRQDREIVHLISEGVVSVGDADTAVSWGPGLRWGAMGPSLLNHLGGGQGGIEHFFERFTGPMTAWWRVLGSPELTAELRAGFTRESDPNRCAISPLAGTMFYWPPLATARRNLTLQILAD